MFEDFSFTSSRAPRLTFDGDDRLMVDSDSTLISPLSSRCPSPRSFSFASSHSQSQRFPRTVRSSLHLRSQPPPPPTSVPPAYDSRRLSIGTLTKKLHEHTLRNPDEHCNGHGNGHAPEDTCVSPRSIPDLVPGSAGRLPAYFLTPPDTDHDEEGYTDGDYFSSVRTSPSSQPSHRQSPFVSPTPVPPEFMPPSPGGNNPPGGNGGGGGEGGGSQEALNVRAQRQQISRMQCNSADIETIRRSLLSTQDGAHMDLLGQDDCHPSSLPPRRSPRRRAATLHRSRSRPVHGVSGSVVGESSVSEQQQQQQQHPRRRKSSSGALMSSSSSNRIDKSYYPASSRELRKKSEQGLRRKSLVSAALASMVEKSL